MREIKTRTNAPIALDDDLLGVLEVLFQEVTVRKELDRSYADMMDEISHLIGQMSDEERQRYLTESLFLNMVTYENERLGAYLKRLDTPARD